MLFLYDWVLTQGLSWAITTQTFREKRDNPYREHSRISSKELIKNKQPLKAFLNLGEGLSGFRV
ncbi:MAG: hypothetical protein CBB87_07730 [Micavibrio sp. TMED27]|nr:hypothetical protein [Micavibrio sp.]OUT90560.1 MAG: hypothetical protein CBB87_07730 [Micavibrio sp. TMED27]